MNIRHLKFFYQNVMFYWIVVNSIEVGSNSLLFIFFPKRVEFDTGWIEFNTIQVNSVEFDPRWVEFNTIHWNSVEFDPAIV